MTIVETQIKLQALIRSGFVPESEFANKIATLGAPSEKQRYWIEKLAAEGEAVKAEAEKPAQASIDLTKLMAFFNAATTRGKLQRPGARLFLSDEKTIIQVRMSNPKGKSAGCLWVATHCGELLGKVTAQGAITLNKGMSDRHEDIINTLKQFAEMPAIVAAVFGRLTGKCAFCYLDLSDHRSTEVGYGKKCATNYGLPWGSKESHQAVITELKQAARIGQETPDWRPTELMPEDYYSL